MSAAKRGSGLVAGVGVFDVASAWGGTRCGVGWELGWGCARCSWSVCCCFWGEVSRLERGRGEGTRVVACDVASGLGGSGFSTRE
jgi:hypothetical protein